MAPSRRDISKFHDVDDMAPFFILDVVNHTYFPSDRVCDVVKEMDPQLPVASEDYPSFAANKPLPFLGAGTMADLGRMVPRLERL